MISTKERGATAFKQGTDQINKVIKQHININSNQEEKTLRTGIETEKPLNIGLLPILPIVNSFENPSGIKSENAQETESETCGLNKNSFIPMLTECERFINFLNNRFSLNLTPNYVITINKANKNATGFFMPKENEEHYTNTTQDLNNINLNTLYLKTNSPYEVLAHETAHFINNNNNVKDCSSNQYHNKHFKKQAEILLLEVKKTNKGYSQTEETELFKEMLTEFNPKPEVFDICQNQKAKKPSKTRNKLYICSCGVKVRCATDLKATCNTCNTQFIKDEGDE